MRVYQGDSTVPNDDRPHTFVEIEPDKFLEVTIPYIDKLDKGLQQRMRAFVRKTLTEEKKSQSFYIRMHKRFFTSIIKVPNLRLVGTF